MSQQIAIDLAIKVLGLAGGSFLFIWGLWQWYEQQRWERAERLDGIRSASPSGEARRDDAEPSGVSAWRFGSAAARRPPSPLRTAFPP
jgi:hypothetical protein